MKNFLIITALTFPIGIFAQGSTNANLQMQMQNVNYYNNINDDTNPVEVNTAIQQQVNPPIQEQQQSSIGNIFGSDLNNNKPCTDCDEVKAAIKVSYSSSGISHGKTFSMKKWTKKISGKADMKLRKMMAQKKKVKTSFDCCFNWG